MSRKKDLMRTNRAIRVHEVRLIDSKGEQAGVVSIEKALAFADADGLDLVEISPNADPPVCKIMNYGKFRFEQAKKKRDAKGKQRQIQLKEVKFKPRIDEHDYLFKCKHIRRFIEHGDKVRAFVHFRGREVTHREIGLKILERIIADVEDIATVEKRPGMEGHQMAMYLVGLDTGGKGKAKPSPPPKPPS